MKTFLNKIVVVLAVLLVTFSCSDFLKEEPNGQLTADKAFATKEDLTGAVHALNRQVLMATKGFISFIPWMQGDDFSTHPQSNKASGREFDVMTVSDENGSLTIDTGSWFWLWKVIKAANFIINGADNTVFPDAYLAADKEKDLIFAKGQAYYWRAWAYFYLVRAWGPVPKVLEDALDMNIPISKVSEIYELIVSDLKEAEKLPVKYTESPWALNGVNVVVSKPAAQATLACVYLTMAGWPMELGTEYYRMAADKALEVITAVEAGDYSYKLYDEYWLIHSKQENLKNQECLLGVYFSSITGTGDGSQSARGTINDMHECTGGAYNDTRAEIGLYCDFPEGDRKEYTYAPVTFVATKGQAYDWWDTNVPEAERQPYFRKSAFTSWVGDYANAEYDLTKSFSSQSNGWSLQIKQVVRLAEVYLWYAEAVGRSGQVNAKAIELLNKVRNRANGKSVETRDIYSASMTSDELAEAAWNEHGWEIAGWYWASVAPRYTDQQRMNRVKTHYEKRLSNPEYTIPGSNGVTMREPFNPTEPWNNTKIFLPYPASDVRQIPTMVNVDKLNMIK